MANQVGAIPKGGLTKIFRFIMAKLNNISIITKLFIDYNVEIIDDTATLPEIDNANEYVYVYHNFENGNYEYYIEVAGQVLILTEDEKAYIKHLLKSEYDKYQEEQERIQMEEEAEVEGWDYEHIGDFYRNIILG